MVGTLAEEGGSENKASSNGGDARIEKVISSSGLKYELTEEGVYVIGFRLPDSGERTQSCVVSPEAVATTGSECMFICSMVADCGSVSDAVMGEALSANADRSERLWCKIGNRLALRILVPLSVSPTGLCDILEELAKDADSAEKQLTGKDEF